MKNTFAWVQVMRFSRLMVVSLVLVGSMLAALPFTNEVGAETTGTAESMAIAVGNFAELCGLSGGALVAMFDFDESLNIANVITTCHGGADDGETCFITPDTTGCMFTRTPEPIAPGLPDAADPGENPQQTTDQGQNTAPSGGVFENPTWGGPLVVMTNHDDVDDTADGANLLCKILGGTSSEHHDWDTSWGLIIFTNCDGGLLDGASCSHYGGTSLCSRIALPEGDTVAPSGSGNEIPAASAPIVSSPTAEPTLVVVTSVNPTPTPTLAPTVAPTSEPTVMPTEVPVEPTIVPTTAPPPPPQNDNSLPPGGGVEEPAPTPTEVVLN